MTAGGETGTRPKARQRSIYCSCGGPRADRAARRRSGDEFLAFHGRLRAAWRDEDDGEEGPRLVLTEDEQRSLYERVALLDRCNEALLARLPGTEMSALGALAFLVREARGRADGGEDRG